MGGCDEGFAACSALWLHMTRSTRPAPLRPSPQIEQNLDEYGACTLVLYRTRCSFGGQRSDGSSRGCVLNIVSDDIKGVEVVSLAWGSWVGAASTLGACSCCRLAAGCRRAARWRLEHDIDALTCCMPACMPG